VDGELGARGDVAPVDLNVGFNNPSDGGVYVMQLMISEPTAPRPVRSSPSIRFLSSCSVRSHCRLCIRGLAVDGGTPRLVCRTLLLPRFASLEFRGRRTSEALVLVFLGGLRQGNGEEGSESNFLRDLPRLVVGETRVGE